MNVYLLDFQNGVTDFDMPGLIIPLAGLALGALGRLVNQRRSMKALSNANAVASAPTPSETGLSTAATQQPQTLLEPRGGQKGSGDEASKPIGPLAKQPATGPVQQNQGIGSPTPAPGENAGLAARLGRESVRRSRRRNKEQQTLVSNAALS